MADTTLYKQIVLEWGQDTDSLIWGMGYSPDNGEHFYVLNTTYGRKYRTEDGDRIWPFLVNKVKAVLDWSNITNKPDLALKTDLTWSNVTGKPDVALKSDVAAVSAVASTASAKATSNAATIASVSSTANSALSVANSNAKVLPNKLDKADLTWPNISGKPDVATKSDLTWANISGKPSIPSTFNGSITDTSTDFNNLVTEGHYDIRFSPSTQGKNGPKQGNWGLLDVKVAGRMLVQTYYSDQSNEVYVRNRHDGTWSGWRWVTFWPS